MFLILSYLHPVHIQYTVNIIHFNIIFLPSPVPPKLSLFFNFYEKVLHMQNTCSLSRPSYVIDWSTVITYAVSAQIMQQRIMQFYIPTLFHIFWFQLIIFGSFHELCIICIRILIHLHNIKFKLILNV